MSLSIGGLAHAAGVGVQTIRFYEREGLIDAPPRKSSGYRVYSEDAAVRIRFIRRAQELGFTLREIRELIALQTDASADCEDVRAVALAKVAEVERKIADLTSMKSSLHSLIGSCDCTGTMRQCGIMECLSEPNATHCPPTPVAG